MSTERAAVLSPCGTWRYLLTRAWDSSKPDFLAFGLNPSVADHEIDDPTVRVLVRVAKDQGAGRLLLANLYGYRSTDPSALKQLSPEDRVGPHADAVLQVILAGMAGQAVLCCWGSGALEDRRDRAVYDMIAAAGAQPVALAYTKGGDPHHPLRVKLGQLVPWPDPRFTTYWTVRHPPRGPITITSQGPVTTITRDFLDDTPQPTAAPEPPDLTLAPGKPGWYAQVNNGTNMVARWPWLELVIDWVSDCGRVVDATVIATGKRVVSSAAALRHQSQLAPELLVARKSVKESRARDALKSVSFFGIEPDSPEEHMDAD